MALYKTRPYVTRGRKQDDEEMMKKEFDPMMEEVNEGWRTRSQELHYLHAPTVI